MTMRRTTSMQLAGTAGCIALALVPWLSGVRHAGYYVAVAAFLGGMILGLRAVLVVFALAFIVAAVMYISATVSPPSGEDQRALVLLYITLVPAGVSLPVFVGVAVRWLLGRRGVVASRARRQHDSRGSGHARNS